MKTPEENKCGLECIRTNVERVCVKPEKGQCPRCEQLVEEYLTRIQQLETEKDQLLTQIKQLDLETKKADKVVLDATCGTRSIWFDKNCPQAVYFDLRQGCVAKKMGTKRYERTMLVEPDVVGDFRHLPFPDESFYHVVFDPPHLHISEKAWIYNMYGSLPEDWQALIRDGFRECMRVLKPYGTLVFKWSDLEITTKEVINAIGCKPLYGHRSGKKMNTHWMVFVKDVSEVNPND